jgi:hypothetical protein
LKLRFRFVTLAGVFAATFPAWGGDNNSIGVVVTSDRQESDLGVPDDAKVTIVAAHTFSNGIIIGGSVEYVNTAFSDDATSNIETTAGYRIHLNDTLSVNGSAGVGGRFQVSGSGDDFAYYVLRVGAEVKLTSAVTWDAVAFRYRDSFDPSDDYLTPQLGTGVTFRLDEHNSVSSKVQYNWKNWDPDTVGFALGFEHSF